ncbi:S1C family serine protease [Nocardioides insulae]|uniref:S1C family serine protease n=1 Tax=Nocardioides insulae TaxID=394734 RepID=UPI0003FD5DB9|nr:trypsin-like peptidase domain-containing protein [Nocardioides insulae]
MTERHDETQPFPRYPGPTTPPPAGTPWTFDPQRADGAASQPTSEAPTRNENVAAAAPAGAGGAATATTTTATQAPAPASGPAPTGSKRSGRSGFVAGVLAASLVVGAGAGLGGAALWNSLGEEPSNGGTSSAVANVVDQGDADAADGSVESVASNVLPSVVMIEVSGEEGSGSGSGIILSADGTILTNNHVASVAGDGGTIRVDFNDGTHAPATVLGTDPLTDTAVIKAQGVSGLTPATIGKSSNLDVGEQVVAIGSPFGLDSTVTSGIVSALDRPVNVGSDEEGNATVYPAIQTDAAINPGNSGGALVDMTGSLVGINSSIRSTSSADGEAGSIGLGFAIPIDSVMPIIDQLSQGETPTHARLGITVSDASASGQSQEAPQYGEGEGQGEGQDEGGLGGFGFGLPGQEEQQQPEQQEQEQQSTEDLEDGAQVQEVSDGSSAGEAGLKSGDIITKVDDSAISSADDLIATVRAYRPGDQVSVTYVRDGKTDTASLTLDSDA